MGQPTRNEPVRIVEVGPRDGLQNISQQVPTAAKIALIQRLIQAGLATVEATSCVSPKWVPQLADSNQVLTALASELETGSVALPVLVPNLQGLDAALRHHVKEVAVFVSASEGFSRKNTNCSVDEALERARQVVAKARHHGVAVRGYVSCIIECPYDGPTAPAAVLRVTRALLDMGCYEISLGDTLGIGAPSDVEALLSVLLETIPPRQLAGHFHDTYGQALANVMKAYSMGLRTFDSSVAGLGGCPYAKGARGNLATEDIVYAFERHGVPTGVDLAELAATGEWISDVLKQPNGSRAGAALAARFRESNTTTPDPATATTTTTTTTTAKTTMANESARKPAPAAATATPSGWKTTQQSERLTVAQKGQSVLVKLTRPRHANTLTAPLVRELTDTIKSLSSQFATVSRIAITGEGSYFCSGLDPGCRAPSSSSSTSLLLGLLDAISEAPQVTVALINGPCVGGGVGLAFACDVRLASAAATFALREAVTPSSLSSLPMPMPMPAFVSAYVVPAWGPALTRAALETARPVTADEVHRIGAVHALYYADDDDDDDDVDAHDHHAGGDEPPPTTTHVLDDFGQGLHMCAPQACGRCQKLAESADGDAHHRESMLATLETMMAASGEARVGITELIKKGVKGIDWDAWYLQLRSRL